MQDQILSTTDVLCAFFASDFSGVLTAMRNAGAVVFAVFCAALISVVVGLDYAKWSGAGRWKKNNKNEKK